MTLAIIFAPAATFMMFALVAVALHSRLNQPGDLARARIATFAPSTRVGASPAASDSPLVRRQQFSTIPGLQRFLQREHRGERLSAELVRAGLPLRVGEYVLARWVAAAIAAVGFWAVTNTLVLAVIGGAAGYVAPALYVVRCRCRRSRQFDDQLVDALTLIANALKSGFSFLQAMQAVADEMPEPIGGEFSRALLEARMGGAVDEAMLKVSQRVCSVDFELVVTAMTVQHQVGGNLTDILQGVVRTVRERHRIEREVRTLTAEQRMSGWVVGLLPVALIVIMSFVNHGYMAGMLSATSGRLLLGLAFFMDVLGLVAIRKLVGVKV